MFNQSGPLELVCDAPPYAIVKACKLVGIESPEDVRWCGISPFLEGRYGPAGWMNANRVERLLWFASQPLTCRCGKEALSLTWCAFCFAGGAKQHYLLGQCDRCKTVYWHNED
jgi:hypothetical protein